MARQSAYPAKVQTLNAINVKYLPMDHLSASKRNQLHLLWDY